MSKRKLIMEKIYALDMSKWGSYNLFISHKACLLVLDFLNQARAGHRPACAWFPKIDPVRTSVCVCVFVCVSAPEAINN